MRRSTTVRKREKMATTPAVPRCTERINLSLTTKERHKLEKVGEREDREITYIAAWFVRWGLERYEELGLTLTDLKNAQYVDVEARAVNARTKKLRLRKQREKLEQDLERAAKDVTAAMNEIEQEEGVPCVPEEKRRAL